MTARRPGVYLITCTVSGNYYVGSSIDMPKRWNGHKTTLRRGINHCPILQHAWNKYGEEAFVFSVLEDVADITLLTVREQYYIDTLLPEYNFSMFANSPMQDPKVAAKVALAMTDKHPSEATRRRIGDAQRGRIQPIAVNQKRSQTMKGSPKILGVSKSAAHKASVKTGMTSKWEDPTYRAMMVESAKNRKRKPEPRSQESRDLTSTSRKAAWEVQRQQGYTNLEQDENGRFKKQT